MSKPAQSGRSHPPRLQHSPSLPNIWFPPHSGPIPPHLADAVTNLKRPSTPPSTKQEPSSAPDVPTKDNSTTKSMSHLRVNYDQSNVLLTPPLTPSSSLRTVASIESVVSGASSVGESVLSDFDTVSTRYLMISNVRKTIDSQALKLAVLQALDSNDGSPQDKIKGISMHLHSNEGIVIFVFFDVRQASSANVILSTPTTGGLAHCIDEEKDWFECRFITAEKVLKLVGGASFVMEPPPYFGLAVEAEGGKQNIDMNPETLIGLLKAQGDLRSLTRVEETDKTPDRQLFRVEFFDVRANENAIQSLDGQTYFGLHLTVIMPNVSTPTTVAQPSNAIGPAGDKSQVRKRFLVIDTTGKPRPKSISVDNEGINAVRSTDSPPLFYTSTSTSPITNFAPALPAQPQDAHIQHAPDHLFFNRGERPLNSSSMPPAAQRSRSTSQSRASHNQEPQTPAMEMSPVQHYYNGCPTPPMSAYPYHYPAPHHQYVPSPTTYGSEFDSAHAMHMNGWSFDQAMMMSPPFHMYGGMVYPAEQWVGPPTHGHPPLGYVAFPPPISPESPAVVTSPISGHPLTPQIAPSPQSAVSSVASPGTATNAVNNDRNQLNISRIEDGQDTRTTVMIKNIPNKMNDKDLLAFIGGVCSRRVDFLYLRMDFQNGCNVGYAFVNFITVEDLLRFAKAKLGEKWNMFSSEKILQMSYANYQGKEALVEKFKNSCIMDERLAWQPKIFYSDGPEMGLPQPFPPPTHLRRKERSTFNRGPLYVPGMMANTAPPSVAPPLRRSNSGATKPPPRK
ncbi:RRM domain-containing protein [Mycena indigotica]|uniref:RRM domain-containing protein n=1 Tax=Mycena indigotica TaxID=2126181 RepID=A0A8H6TF63_9AGAR|nr:RRM domain-containing protein [Mycena indigotica]KAF7315581.1 RRM domain-containing protein [Mycena indigotica]